MVDMFYDHLLAANWSQWCRQPLDRFAAEAYGLLGERPEQLPERLAGIVPAMREHDWLCSYREMRSISVALDRISVYRLRQPNNLGGGGRSSKRITRVLLQISRRFSGRARFCEAMDCRQPGAAFARVTVPPRAAHPYLIDQP